MRLGLSLSTLEPLGYIASRTGLFERQLMSHGFFLFHFLFHKSSNCRYCVSVISFQMTLYNIFELATKSSIPPSRFQLTHLLLYSIYKPSISAYYTCLTLTKQNTLAAPRSYTKNTISSLNGFLLPALRDDAATAIAPAQAPTPQPLRPLMRP